jgi:hypothetical protein
MFRINNKQLDVQKKYKTTNFTVSFHKENSRVSVYKYNFAVSFHKGNSRVSVYKYNFAVSFHKENSRVSVYTYNFAVSFHRENSRVSVYTYNFAVSFHKENSRVSVYTYMLKMTNKLPKQAQTPTSQQEIHGVWDADKEVSQVFSNIQTGQFNNILCFSV